MPADLGRRWNLRALRWRAFQRLVLTSVWLLAPTASWAQSILTVAGGGSDDGRPATVVGLGFPSGVAVDADGNLYVVETDARRIRKVAISNGLISTIAGDGAFGPAGDARLSDPGGVAIDTAGNVYIADTANDRIRKLSVASGVIKTIAGQVQVQGGSGDGGPATEAELAAPTSVAVDDHGNVYIADTLNNRIRKVDNASGIISTVAGTGFNDSSGDGGLAVFAGLNAPSGLAIDSSGTLYIAESNGQRIRKVDLQSGIISTVAGNGMAGFSGDGGPAVSASFNYPANIAIDLAGNLYIADGGNQRVRRVNAAGLIATIAGSGASGFSGDGGPATAAEISNQVGIAVGRDGAVYIADGLNHRVRRVASGSGIISTVAGNGGQSFNGDGGPATAALLRGPNKVVVDSSGDIYFAELSTGRVRKLSVATGNISTVAGGQAQPGQEGDGGPASAAQIDPLGLAIDAAGNLYIADTYNGKIRKVSAETRIVSTVAGGGTSLGDGGPATLASLSSPSDVAVDTDGNLYIADTDQQRIRKIDVHSGIITTVAGNGVFGFAGDDGPATSAMLGNPNGVAVDTLGNIYIADTSNVRIREVTASGVIRTIAGDGDLEFSEASGPATAVGIGDPLGIAVDRSGDVYIADAVYGRILKVDSSSGFISTIAGNTGGSGLSGDGGPALAARLTVPTGVALNGAGSIYVADTLNNRIRAILACVTVPSPTLQQPTNGATSTPTSPRLDWLSVKGAFHYDVYLDKANSPETIIGTDLVAPTYNPSNLDPLTTYYWKVVGKGDVFCAPLSSASSGVFSFTTTGTCVSPGSFAGKADVTGNSAAITWQRSERASNYDLYLSPSNPPRRYATGLTDLSWTVSGLAPGTTYSWKVVAHATCDGSQVTETSIGTLTTPGGCGSASAFALNSPGDGQVTVPAGTTLSWSVSPGAASYDVYLGSGSSPPLYISDVQETSVAIPRLSPGGGYSWKVVAKAACDPTKSATSAVRRFTVAACGTPGVPTSLSSKANVSAGATYSIRWTDAPALDAGGSYLIERATDAAFSNIVDHQQTRATSASFVTSGVGTYYHRVRAIAGCDATKRSAPTDTVEVTVNAATPLVVFSMLPQAVITKLGDRLEDQKTSFAIENLGLTTVQVFVEPQLTGSVPFFTIVDPVGGDASFVTLDPHKPKTLDIHYSGPSNTLPGSYQGGFYVMAAGQALAFTPQAYVNLKVGGDANAAAPKLLVNGSESDFAYFPAVTGDDAARPAIQVDLFNGGAVPMEVAGEIGPEAWLKLEKDWNASAVPVSAFRTLRLSTQRTKAVSGSALPRFTYLTVRNKAGQAARLLVEDSGGITNTVGRSAPLGAGEMSAVVPYVASGTAILLTNSGSDPVPVDLVYTPEGSDGFDASTVLRASIVIPPNDVVSLTDPLVQIFGKTADATGSIEILSAKLAQLAIRAEGRKAASSGGVYTTSMPVAMRGEGARVDSPHRLAGITSSTSTKTSLIVTETSGREKTTAHITLYDNTGIKRGEQTIDLGRYGTKRIDDVAQTLAGGANLTAARVDIDVTSGGGAVIALAMVTDRTSGAGAGIIAGAIAQEVHLSSLGRPIHAEATTTASSQTFTIPGAITNSTLKTTVGVSALASAVNATVALRDSTTGQTTRQTISVVAGQTSEVDIPTGSGTVTLTTDAPVSLYARVRGTNIADALPVVSAYSEGLTGGGSAMPLYADGLEHSIDTTRGRKTSLILTELAGQSATVNVRLYEPGSRTAAVAEKDFTISANGELRLDNLFVSMGLESGPDDLDQRRKNQINVAAVVTATSGGGVIAAEALMTDNKTGDRRTIPFVPAGGVPATSLQPGVLSITIPTRHRAAGK